MAGGEMFRGFPSEKCTQKASGSVGTCDSALGLQLYPQKVVRPPKPTPTTFSGGGWSPCDSGTFLTRDDWTLL